MRLIAAGAALLLSQAVARAETLYGHVSSFRDFTRISIEEPRPGDLHVTHRLDQVRITSPDHIVLAVGGTHSSLIPRSSVEKDGVTVQLQRGSSVRQYRSGVTRIIDIFAASQKASPPDLSSRQQTAVHRGVINLIPNLPLAFGAQLESAESTPSREPALLSTRQGVSGKISGSRPVDAGHSPALTSNGKTPPPSQAIGALPATMSEHSRAILLPFSADVGAAAIRRPHYLVAYFDESRPIDLSALQTDPIFEHATVLMQSNYTEITLPIEADRTTTLSRVSDGWRLIVDGVLTDVPSIRVHSSGHEVQFLMASPGKVLTVSDPISGTTLLIGTDREVGSPFSPSRRSATFIAERSEIGVVVQPLSDGLSLRPIKGGFALFNDGGAALAFANKMQAAEHAELQSAFTRSSDFPKGTDQDLLNQLHKQLLAAALAPSRARLVPRLSAAQTMIAVGLEREARTLIRVAFADDPAALDNPSARWLRALAETLANLEPAGLLDDVALPTTEETRLWRALTSRPNGTPNEADLAVIRRCMPILLTYPRHLRDIAAGLAAPLLLAGNNAEDLDAVARLPTTSQTSVAQAVALSRGGDSRDALVRLDALVKTGDLKTSSDAILAAALLRVGLKRMAAGAAADTLSMHRLDWRATGREGEVIMQEADLRRDAGQITRAFQLWREVERRFPDLAGQAKANITTNLIGLTNPKLAAGLSPSDFVRVIEDCAQELAADNETAAKLAPILAERLEALDLSARATGILKQLLNSSGPGTPKAVLGATLGALLLEQEDVEGARNAIDGSESPDLPAPLTRERHLLLARILERQGDHVAALTVLKGDDDASVRDLRSAVYAAAGRWHDAKLTLETLVRQLPGEGILKPEQANLILRLAAAASRDGDAHLLFELTHRVEGRFPDPGQQQTFDLMIAPLAQQAPSQPMTRTAG